MKKVIKNKNLQIAKKEKNDEFYTLLSDIERELEHYKEHFKGKIIYCNCDDPNKSNFSTYFIHNFKQLEVPDDYERNNVEIKKDIKVATFGNICWYTNLYIEKRNERLLLHKTYNPIDYPEYDNYLAISVDRVNDIPVDYKGIIGVPITFISKYNPSQFEIIGSDNDIKSGLLPHLIKPHWKNKIDRAYIHSLRKYARIFIKHKPPIE